MSFLTSPLRQTIYRQVCERIEWTPGILSFSKKAKQLREWARNGVFSIDANHRPSRTRQLEKQRHELNKRTEKILEQQKILNSFYKELGFDALPRNHELTREWEQNICRLRKAAEKIKKKQQLRSKKASGNTCSAAKKKVSPMLSPKSDTT